MLPKDLQVYSTNQVRIDYAWLLIMCGYSIKWENGHSLVHFNRAVILSHS